MPNPPNNNQTVKDSVNQSKIGVDSNAQFERFDTDVPVLNNLQPHQSIKEQAKDFKKELKIDEDSDKAKKNLIFDIHDVSVFRLYFHLSF